MRWPGSALAAAGMSGCSRLMQAGSSAHGTLASPTTTSAAVADALRLESSKKEKIPRLRFMRTFPLTLTIQARLARRKRPHACVHRTPGRVGQQSGADWGSARLRDDRGKTARGGIDLAWRWIRRRRQG